MIITTKQDISVGMTVPLGPYAGAVIDTIAANGWVSAHWLDGRTFKVRVHWLQIPRTSVVKVETIEEGDYVVIDGSLTLVESLQENGRMDGVWLHCGGLSRFYKYDDTIDFVVNAAELKQAFRKGAGIK